MSAGKTSASLALLTTPQRRPEASACEAEDLVGAVRRYVDTMVAPLRERLVAQVAEIEALKAQVPDRGYINRAISDEVQVRFCALPPPPERGLSVKDLEAAIVPVREQIAQLRARPEPAPGRDGLPGLPGRDGAPGKDGADGLGFDDLQVERINERRVVFKFIRGDHVREFPVDVPVLIYRGVHHEGTIYERGDTVTWAGCLWHANEVTASKPGNGNSAWTMCSKAGRDGKAGKSAYEIACERDGFKGSEADWLKSLRGPPGRDGKVVP